MSVQISIKKTKESRVNSFNPEKIEFGKVFTDHMVVCDYHNGKWEAPQIVPFSEIAFSPALSALHYGQAIFEGMKAFKNKNNEATLFRAEQNAQRFNRSAVRMCMPEIPENLFLSSIEALVDLDKNWIPVSEGGSLYIRPFMFATDAFLGIKPSDTYRFMVYACPAGTYYSAPVKLYIEEEYVRAVKGGVGTAKCAGNYAASLYPARLAREKGFDQVLWIDAIEHKYLEETGTSNVFIRCGNTVFTPALSGSILPGITRDSVITLLKEWGYDVKEQPVALADLLSWHEQELIDELFVSGTAVTVVNSQLFGTKDKVCKISPAKEPVTERIKDTLYKIRTLQTEDTYDWVKVVGSVQKAETVL